MILAYLFAVLKSVICGSTMFFTTNLTSNVDVFDVLVLRFLLGLVVLWLLKVTTVIKGSVGVSTISIVKSKREAKALNNVPKKE